MLQGVLGKEGNREEEEEEGNREGEEEEGNREGEEEDSWRREIGRREIRTTIHTWRDIGRRRGAEEARR